MNTVDKVLGFSLQEPFLWTNIYTRQKTPRMKSQAASRKKLPIMGSCTNTRNFDTGQIDATSRQLLHSSRPQIDMKTPRRIMVCSVPPYSVGSAVCYKLFFLYSFAVTCKAISKSCIYGLFCTLKNIMIQIIIFTKAWRKNVEVFNI